MEKKVYETPEVTKVEIDFSDRIIASGCTLASMTNMHCGMGTMEAS